MNQSCNDFCKQRAAENTHMIHVMVAYIIILLLIFGFAIWVARGGKTSSSPWG